VTAPQDSDQEFDVARWDDYQVELNNEVRTAWRAVEDRPEMIEALQSAAPPVVVLLCPRGHELLPVTLQVLPTPDGPLPLVVPVGWSARTAAITVSTSQLSVSATASADSGWLTASKWRTASMRTGRSRLNHVSGNS
jgi:hypothetical protein